MEKLERRFVSPQCAPVTVEERADGKKVIAGYAAVHYSASDAGTQYRLYDDLVERIREGAFTRACQEKHDVRGLYNHDPDNLLGRSSSGTCRYSVDAKGLKYEIDVDPQDPDHQRVLAKINRGDLNGSSFAFRATKVTWEDNEGSDSVRWVEDVTLYDVGPVTYPAYDATTTGLRAEDGRGVVEEEVKEWKASQMNQRNDEVNSTQEAEEAAPVGGAEDTPSSAEGDDSGRSDGVAELREQLTLLTARIDALEQRSDASEGSTDETSDSSTETGDDSADEQVGGRSLDMLRRRLDLLKVKSRRPVSG